MTFPRSRTLRNGEVPTCRRNQFLLGGSLFAILVGAILATVNSPGFAESVSIHEMIKVSGEIGVGYEVDSLYGSGNEIVDREYQLVTFVDLDTKLKIGENSGADFSISGETGSNSKPGLDQLLLNLQLTNVELKIGKFEDIHFSSETNFDASLANEYLEQDATGLSILVDLNPWVSLEVTGFRVEQSKPGETSRNSRLATAVVTEIEISDELPSFGLGFLSDLQLDDDEFGTSSAPALFLQIHHGWGNWTGLLEYGAALSSYREVDAFYANPRVTTVEFQYDFRETTSLGLLFERSHSLFEQPEQRAGIYLRQAFSTGVHYAFEFLQLRYSTAQQLRYELESERQFIFTLKFDF